MLRNLLYRKHVRQFATKLSEHPDRSHRDSIYVGPSYEAVKIAHGSYISPSIKPFYKTPLLIYKGRGQWLWDHTGKRYLDMFGGICTVSVGHCHPKIVAALTDQASRLGHISPIYMHPHLYEYTEKLTSKFPSDLNVVYLTNSGSEANELAFFMARLYTNQDNIISLRNCYHGGTHTCAASSAMSNWKYVINQPSGHIHMMNPDVYKGPWGGSSCRDCPVPLSGRSCECTNGTCMAAEKYFQEFTDIFEHSLPRRRVAAFVAESIQGIGGVVQYPRLFLQKVYNFIQQNGGICIADEVQTGFGRTGEHYWGFEGHNVNPDIVTMAKGIGNGFPLGAVVTRKEIADCLNQSLHFNTFGGNPLACAVGSTVLDIIDEERLQENSHAVGTHLLHRLSTLLLEFPNIVGDVRGKGLMIGVELISDTKTKQPIKPEHMTDIFEDIKESGLLIGKGGVYGNIIRIKPPMCVTKEDADFTFEVIKIALQRHRDRQLTDKESVFCNAV